MEKTEFKFTMTTWDGETFDRILPLRDAADRDTKVLLLMGVGIAHITIYSTNDVPLVTYYNEHAPPEYEMSTPPTR